MVSIRLILEYKIKLISDFVECSHVDLKIMNILKKVLTLLNC
jgi:hypothetical protein